MFFMTRKRFEEEVQKRIDEWHMRRAMERIMDDLRRDLCKLVDRVDRLEGVERLVEVKNAKEF
jgi:hypothetical protein